jgi:rod shape-determining protein MreC
LAQVVAWDGNSDFRVIRINKGIKHGIRLQAPVITSEGLVGYIYRMTDHYADVLTILDSGHRVDGLIQRVRAHGIVEGRTESIARMKNVTRTEPIILNDTVITSGLGNIYPKGIKIGSIVRIERESYGITQYLELKPAVDFGRLEEVVILVSSSDLTHREEWNALDEMGNEERKGSK